MTPPVWVCLYLGTVVSGLKIEEIVKHLIPFYVLLIVSFVMIIYVPSSISIWRFHNYM